MNCREVKYLLVPFSAGMLGPEEAGAVEEHLSGCPSCRGELAGLEEVGDLLDRYRRERRIPDYGESQAREIVNRAFPEPRGESIFQVFWRRRAVVGLAAVLLGIFSFFVSLASRLSLNGDESNVYLEFYSEASGIELIGVNGSEER